MGECRFRDSIRVQHPPVRSYEAVRDVNGVTYRHNRLHHSRAVAQAQTEKAEGYRGGSEGGPSGG